MNANTGHTDSKEPAARSVIEINATVADRLRQMAEVLELQMADGFRVAAYQRAAETVDRLEKSLTAIIGDHGLAGLVALPGIGRGIGSAIIEMLSTGYWPALDRLKGELRPEKLFQTIPGIGPGLAEKIHDQLQIETLEELELAAHDGRLKDIPGLGARRVAAIQAILKERLGHRRIRRDQPRERPDVGVLLKLDAEYRKRARAGTLRLITPKRFNPEGKAWLPVWHTRRGDWNFTILFSNTERAHKLKKTEDWVVVYYHQDDAPEGQCTIVTAASGNFADQRIVRGRESECAAHYAGKKSKT